MIYFPSTHLIENIQHHDFSLLQSVIKENNIQYLDFSNKSIDAQTGQLIVQAVKGLDIKGINFSKNQIGPLGAVALVESLRDSEIVEIDLSSNAIGAAVIDVLRAVTSSPIKIIKLAYNQVGVQGLQAVAPFINRSNLKVDLSGNIGLHPF